MPLTTPTALVQYLSTSMSNTSASFATKVASIDATLWIIAFIAVSTLYRRLGMGEYPFKNGLKNNGRYNNNYK